MTSLLHLACEIETLPCIFHLDLSGVSVRSSPNSELDSLPSPSRWSATTSSRSVWSSRWRCAQNARSPSSIGTSTTQVSTEQHPYTSKNRIETVAHVAHHEHVSWFQVIDGHGTASKRISCPPCNNCAGTLITSAPILIAMCRTLVDSLQSLCSRMLTDVPPLISFCISGSGWCSSGNRSSIPLFQCHSKHLREWNFPRARVAHLPFSFVRLVLLWWWLILLPPYFTGTVWSSVLWMNPHSCKLVKYDSDNMHWGKTKFSIRILSSVSKSSVQSYGLFKSRQRVKF